MPDLPEHVTTAEIESHLDRVAVEIEATGSTCLVQIFEWLEQQLDNKRRQVSALSRITQRAKKAGAIEQDRPAMHENIS